MNHSGRLGALAAWCGFIVLSSGCTRQQTPPDRRAAEETAIRQADLAWSQAQSEGLAVVSSDEAFDTYGVERIW